MLGSRDSEVGLKISKSKTAGGEGPAAKLRMRLPAWLGSMFLLLRQWGLRPHQKPPKKAEMEASRLGR
jgi:hypothetical protein